VVLLLLTQAVVAEALEVMVLTQQALAVQAVVEQVEKVILQQVLELQTQVEAVVENTMAKLVEQVVQELLF
jgi:hypothetical protein